MKKKFSGKKNNFWILEKKENFPEKKVGPQK